MKETDDFFKNFDSSSSKNNISFGKTFFVPFISGVLGSALVLGIVLGVPNVRNSIFNVSASNLSKETSSTLSVPSTGTVDKVSLKDYSDTAIFAASKTLPSIVGINVEYTVTSNFMHGLSQIGSASGSGIIISSDGYILTNNHIINSSDSSIYYEVSEATKVYVYLYNDETPYEAKIIGTDEETDLAVIKIEKNDLVAAELADSSSIKIGEFAMAIGNPLGMQSSVTSGIVSAVNREVDTEDGNTFTLIQTDAAINSGNSGGALVNAEGKVIGINTLKLSGSGIEGMGFAIPINDTIDIYNQLIKNGKVLRPYIGITGIDIDQRTATQYNYPQGIYVKAIDKEAPVSSSDLKPGDIIVSIENSTVKTMDELNEIKKSKNIGDTVKLGIYRNGETLEVSIILGEQP